MARKKWCNILSLSSLFYCLFSSALPSLQKSVNISSRKAYAPSMWVVIGIALAVFSGIAVAGVTFPLPGKTIGFAEEEVCSASLRANLLLEDVPTLRAPYACKEQYFEITKKGPTEDAKIAAIVDIGRKMLRCWDTYLRGETDKIRTTHLNWGAEDPIFYPCYKFLINPTTSLPKDTVITGVDLNYVFSNYDQFGRKLEPNELHLSIKHQLETSGNGGFHLAFDVIKPGLEYTIMYIDMHPSKSVLEMTMPAAIGGSVAGTLVGAGVGAKIGASIGTIFGPGPGTAIGAAAGGIVGGIIGAFTGAAAGTGARQAVAWAANIGGDDWSELNEEQLQQINAQYKGKDGIMVIPTAQLNAFSGQQERQRGVVYRKFYTNEEHKQRIGYVVDQFDSAQGATVR